MTDSTALVEAIARYVEHLRDDYLSSCEPVTKVARLIRVRFGALPEDGECPLCRRYFTDDLGKLAIHVAECDVQERP